MSAKVLRITEISQKLKDILLQSADEDLGHYVSVFANILSKKK